MRTIPNASGDSLMAFVGENWSIGKRRCLAELEDRQLLVGEVLRTSGDAEVGDGFQGGVQEKVTMSRLFRSVKDYSIQSIV